MSFGETLRRRPEGSSDILGGGWSVIWLPGMPTPVTLAVKLSVPWD